MSVKTAAVQTVSKIRAFWIAFLQGKDRSDEFLSTVLEYFAPNVVFVYFWGDCLTSSKELLEHQKKMRDMCPASGNCRVEVLEERVLWSDERRCQVMAKEVWHGPGETDRMQTISMFVFEKQEGGNDVKCVSYQETKIGGMTDGCS
ncbi:hypothetical protein HDU85_005642 [Gaertneriomyces sp. JEL0708]|nr:hypothetical protein HDU85_005642 [Gaertneriomyces sp. JEL0708]